MDSNLSPRRPTDPGEAMPPDVRATNDAEQERLTGEMTGGDGTPVRGPRKHLARYEAAGLGLRNYWYPALQSKELKGKPVGVTLLGEEVVFVRDKGKAFGIEGRCPHRGVPLSEGRREFPCTISCAYHGWTFNVESGALVAALTDGPDSNIVGKVTLRTYPVTERQGIVWVFVGDQEPPPLEADVPTDFLDPKTLAVGRVQTNLGNWRLAMENALDSSHAFYLHRPAWINTLTHVQAFKGKYWVEIRDDRYVGYKTEVPIDGADYPGLGWWPRRSWWKSRRRHIVKYVGSLPGAAQVEGVLEGTTVYSWFVPVSETQYRWFQFLGTQRGFLGRLWFRIKYTLWWRWIYQGQFRAQDRRVNEFMHPFYAEQGGWKRERLYRPDVVITAWRRFVDDRARGIQHERPVS